MNRNDNQGRNRPATRFEKLVGWPFLVCVVILFLYFLTACTAISHKPPPSDWPKLEVSVKQIGYWELQRICGSDGIIVQCNGYAWIDFNRMACTIYFHTNDEYGQLTLEHERDHCAGKDHIGGSTLADGWNEWKKTQRRAMK